MIDSYSFGSITVDGVNYRTDVIVYPGRTQDGWWRKKGHDLYWDDIGEILDYGPDLLIIGTGKFGRMRVGAEIKNRIQQRGIELIVKRTSEAVSMFNELSPKKKTVAALHLTC